MPFYITPYVLVGLLSAALASTVALVTWRRRTKRGATSLALLMVAVTEWALGAALELGSVGIPAKVFWSQVEYIGTLSAPILFLVFALEYNRLQHWLTRRRLALLFLIPTVTLALAWTNDLHGWIWTGYTPSPVGDNLLVYGHGIAFWIGVTGYSYLALLLGGLLLTWSVFRFSSHYWEQSAVLLIGLAVPWVANVMYLLGSTPLPGLEPTPLALSITGAIFAYALFRFQLFELVPVARDAVIEGMEDGVIVLDAENRVVDLNGAAQEQLNKPAPQAIGRLANEVLSDLMDLSRYLREPNLRTEVALTVRGIPRRFELRISGLGAPHGRQEGRLIILHDVTRQWQTNERLQRQLEELGVLHELAVMSSMAHDEDTLIMGATRLIGAKLYPDNFGILLMNEADGQLLPHSSYHLPPDVEGTTIPPGQGIIGAVAADGRPRRSGNVSQEPAYIVLDPATRSKLCVPLQVGERVLGVINAESGQMDAFSIADEQLLITFAGQLATAIDRLRAENELKHLATTDVLTGAANRRFFYDLADRGLELSRRTGRPLSAIMLDIDRFKLINDTYGHAAGDQVLRTLAQVCQKQIRETDLFGRYGGEEFAILLVDTNQQDAAAIAERLRQSVAKETVTIGGAPIQVTVSAGVVQWDPDIATVGALLDRADAAMYAAKAAGRNQIAVGSVQGQTFEREVEQQQV